MRRWTLIVIHGVGDSPPGASLLEVSEGFRAEHVSAERSDLIINGVCFPRLRAEHPVVSQIIEVNWSDVASPRRHAVSVADYGVRIVAALLDVASHVTGAGTSAARAYRWCFEALLVYCIYPALVAMLCLTVPAGAIVVTGLGGACFVVGLTLNLKRFGGALWFGWVWAAAIAAATVLFAAHILSDRDLVRVTAIAYVGGQVVTSFCLLLTLLVIACRSSLTVDRRVASAALFYFPLFILSALGALLWALAFATIKGLSTSNAPFETWQHLYSSALSTIGYHLALVEFTFAALVALVGTGLLAVGVAYARRTHAPATDAGQHAGALARDGVRNVLAAGAVMFALLSVVYLVSAATSWQSNRTLTVLQVYSISALRFVPYVPLVIGPLATVAGIVVDVLFYISGAKPLSTGAVLRERFGIALTEATSLGSPVVVCAHSQGSVIAVDVIGQKRGQSPSLLVTAGSPLHSLYERFLGSTPETRAATASQAFQQPGRWINFSRVGDYIGAGQERSGVKEISLGAGGHTGYWNNPALWHLVLEQLSERH